MYDYILAIWESGPGRAALDAPLQEWYSATMPVICVADFATAEAHFQRSVPAVYVPFLHSVDHVDRLRHFIAQQRVVYTPIHLMTCVEKQVVRHLFEVFDSAFLTGMWFDHTTIPVDVEELQYRINLALDHLRQTISLDGKLPDTLSDHPA